MRNKAIGIDPHSAGAVCVLVDTTLARVVVREYPITGDALGQFVRWIKEQADTVVALEGRNGQGKPFERALLCAGVPFYSFTAYEVAKFRSAVLGQNKNNERDAEAVARYALALETQNRLELSRRVWFVDEEMQTVTRLYSQKRVEATRETNRLWKALRKASGDLYLAFRGSHPEFSFAQSLLKLKSVVQLLAASPDVSSWHLIPRQELMRLAGGPHRGREILLEALQRLSAKLPSFSSTTELLIQSSAAVLLVLLATLEKLERQMHELTSENESVQCLCGHRGIAVLTAATMMAEIVDIRRFPTNNHLASYAGLARHEHKTGKSGTEIATAIHNHRLKNAFFAAAKNITLHNPDSHLTAYYRSLLKRGMSITEAYKRVGRALVRRIYRELKAMSEQHQHIPAAIPSEATEGVTATGSDREANEAPCDMTPSDAQYTPKLLANRSLQPAAGKPRLESTHLAAHLDERRAKIST
jgi:transposase